MPCNSGRRKTLTVANYFDTQGTGHYLVAGCEPIFYLLRWVQPPPTASTPPMSSESSQSIFSLCFAYPWLFSVSFPLRRDVGRLPLAVGWASAHHSACCFAVVLPLSRWAEAHPTLSARCAPTNIHCLFRRCVWRFQKHCFFVVMYFSPKIS